MEVKYPKPIKMVRVDHARKPYWEYECECGNHFVSLRYRVDKGEKTHCGCKSENNLKGKTFGFLTAKEYMKGGKWKCLCSCGNETFVGTNSLKKGATRSCGCYQKLVAKQRRSGGDNPDRVDALYRRAYTHVKNRHIHKLKFQLSELFSFEEWKEVVDKPCVYCGKEPSRVLTDEISGTTIKISGVDRLDSSKGYSVGNVVPCCWDCNIAKSDMSLDQFAEFASRLANNLDNIKKLVEMMKQ